MDEDRKPNDLPANCPQFGLYSRHVVLPGATASALPRVAPALILVAGESVYRVIECGADGPNVEASLDCPVEDLGDLYLLPGLVDLNCCFNSDAVGAGDESACPESASFSATSSCPTGSAEEYWEDYATGTRAAAAGGVTTVIESPTLRYASLLTADAVARKIRHLEEQQLYCDVGVLAYVGSSNLDCIHDMAAAGALGFLGYMVPPSAHVSYLESEEDLRRSMALIGETGRVLVLHPERTSSRFLFMASPFRQQAREDEGADALESPVVKCFAAAFPDDRYCGSSSDASPFTQETPVKLSPQQVEDLERSINRHQDDLENLVEVEMKSYTESGDTYYIGSPVKRRSPVVERTVLQLTTVLGDCNKQAPPRQSFRPPPISCRHEKKISETSDYSMLLANSPPHWEANGTAAILKCLQSTPCRVHIASLSSASAVCQAKKARTEDSKLRLTWEVSVPHLYFSAQDVKVGDTRFKTSPPIRDTTNRNHLVELVKRAAVDCVCSSHRPIKPGLKYLQTGNFHRALSGISNMGLTLPALWSIYGYEDPLAAIPMIARLTSTRPAQILGLGKKGEIAVGKDADFAVFDIASEREVRIGNLHVKHPQLSPFLGEQLSGTVVRTYLRGKLVFDCGQFVPRGRAMSR